jgi:hypothetical protein
MFKKNSIANRDRLRIQRACRELGEGGDGIPKPTVKPSTSSWRMSRGIGRAPPTKLPEHARDYFRCGSDRRRGDSP